MDIDRDGQLPTQPQNYAGVIPASQRVTRSSAAPIGDAGTRGSVALSKTVRRAERSRRFQRASAPRQTSLRRAIVEAETLGLASGEIPEKDFPAWLRDQTEAV